MIPSLSLAIKGIATAVGTSVALAVTWWGWGLTADPLVRRSATAAYQLRADAEAKFEQLAAEAETDRLTTQLAIVKIKIDRFVEVSRIRALTESEQIELRAVERERDVILDRLATKG